MASAEMKKKKKAARRKKKPHGKVLLKIPPPFLQSDPPLPTKLVPPPDKQHICTSLHKQRGLVLCSNPGRKEDQKLGEAQKFHGGSGKTSAESRPHWTDFFSFLPEITVPRVFAPNTCPDFVKTYNRAKFKQLLASGPRSSGLQSIRCKGCRSTYQHEHNPALLFPNSEGQEAATLCSFTATQTIAHLVSTSPARSPNAKISSCCTPVSGQT